MFGHSKQIKVQDRIEHLATLPAKELVESLYTGEHADLILESVTLEDLENTLLFECDVVPSMMLEAIKAKAAQLNKRVQAFSRALGQQLKPAGLSVAGTDISKPRKSGAVAIQIAKMTLSDGQSISMAFHAPDNDPLKINPDDTLIAFRFMLNSRDVTHVVAPSGGRDISLKQATLALSNLAEKNSSKFQGAQADREAKAAELEAAQQQIESLDADTEAKAAEIESAEKQIEANRKRTEQLQSQIATQNEIQEELKNQLAPSPAVELQSNTTKQTKRDAQTDWTSYSAKEQAIIREYDRLRDVAEAKSIELNELVAPHKSSMGLVSDEFRETPEYKGSNAAYNAADAEAKQWLNKHKKFLLGVSKSRLRAKKTGATFNAAPDGEELTLDASQDAQKLAALDAGEFTSGSIYDSEKLSHITTIAKRIRTDIAAAKKAGKIPKSVTISVKKSSGHGIDLTLKNLGDDIPLFADSYLEKLDAGEEHPTYEYSNAVEGLRKYVNALVDQYNYDDSEPMTDYFSVNFYGGRLDIDWDLAKARQPIELVGYQSRQAAQGLFDGEPLDYEARYRDRVERLEATDNPSLADEILNEEYADDERHMEGTGKVESAHRSVRSRAEGKARDAENLAAQQRRDENFVQGEWVYTGYDENGLNSGYSTSEREADAARNRLATANPELEFKVEGEYIDAGTFAYYVKKRKAPKANESGSLHWYGMSLRPYAPATTPSDADVVRSIDANEVASMFPNAKQRQYRHGAVAYNQPLSTEQAEQFDMVYLNGIQNKEAESVLTKLDNWLSKLAIADEAFEEADEAQDDDMFRIYDDFGGVKDQALLNRHKKKVDAARRKVDVANGKIQALFKDYVSADGTADSWNNAVESVQGHVEVNGYEQLAEDTGVEVPEVVDESTAKRTQYRMAFMDGAIESLKNMESLEPKKRKQMVLLASRALGTGKSPKKGERVADQARRISEQMTLVEQLQGETKTSLDGAFATKPDIKKFLESNRIAFNRRGTRDQWIETILDYRDSALATIGGQFDLMADRQDVGQRFANGESIPMADVESAFAGYTSAYRRGDIAFTKALESDTLPALDEQGEDYETVESLVERIDAGTYPDFENTSDKEIFSQWYEHAQVTNTDILPIEGKRFLMRETGSEPIAKAVQESVSSLWYTDALKSEYAQRNLPPLETRGRTMRKGGFRAVDQKIFEVAGTIGGNDFVVFNKDTGEELASGLNGQQAMALKNEKDAERKKQVLMELFDKLTIDNKTLAQIADEPKPLLLPMTEDMLTTASGLHGAHSTMAFERGSIRSKGTLRRHAEDFLAHFSDDFAEGIGGSIDLDNIDETILIKAEEKEIEFVNAELSTGETVKLAVTPQKLFLSKKGWQSVVPDEKPATSEKKAKSLEVGGLSAMLESDVRTDSLLNPTIKAAHLKGEPDHVYFRQGQFNGDSDVHSELAERGFVRDRINASGYGGVYIYRHNASEAVLTNKGFDEAKAIVAARKAEEEANKPAIEPFSNPQDVFAVVTPIVSKLKAREEEAQLTDSKAFFTKADVASLQEAGSRVNAAHGTEFEENFAYLDQWALALNQVSASMSIPEVIESLVDAKLVDEDMMPAAPTNDPVAKLVADLKLSVGMVAQGSWSLKQGKESVSGMANGLEEGSVLKKRLQEANAPRNKSKWFSSLGEFYQTASKHDGNAPIIDGLSLNDLPYNVLIGGDSRLSFGDPMSYVAKTNPQEAIKYLEDSHEFDSGWVERAIEAIKDRYMTPEKPVSGSADIDASVLDGQLESADDQAMFERVTEFTNFEVKLGTQTVNLPNGETVTVTIDDDGDVARSAYSALNETHDMLAGALNRKAEAEIAKVNNKQSDRIYYYGESGSSLIETQDQTAKLSELERMGIANHYGEKICMVKCGTNFATIVPVVRNGDYKLAYYHEGKEKAALNNFNDIILTSIFVFGLTDTPRESEPENDQPAGESEVFTEQLREMRDYKGAASLDKAKEFQDVIEQAYAHFEQQGTLEENNDLLEAAFENLVEIQNQIAA